MPHSPLELSVLVEELSGSYTDASSQLEFKGYHCPGQPRTPAMLRRREGVSPRQVLREHLPLPPTGQVPEGQTPSARALPQRGHSLTCRVSCSHLRLSALTAL